MSLDVRVDDGERAATLVLAGELDIATVEEAERGLARARELGPHLVIDLREVRFLDSTGLRFVLRADARARDEGGTLTIVPGPEDVHRVFRIAGLEGRLAFAEPGDEQP